MAEEADVSVAETPAQESSPETTTTELVEGEPTVSEDVSVDAQTPEAKTVPYERFQEVIAKKNELEKAVREAQVNRGQIQDQGQVDEGLTLLNSLVDQRLAPVQEQLAISQFRSSHPDANKYEARMIELINSDPKLADVGMLEYVYKAAKADGLEVELSKATATGKKEAIKSIQDTKAVTSGENPETPRSTKTLTEADVKGMSSKELLELIR